MKAQIDELVSKTTELQHKLAIAANQAQTVAQAEFEKRSEDITPNLVRAPTMPAKKQIDGYGILFQTLQAWVIAGADSPFSWDALHQQAATSIDPATMTKHLLGDLWLKWYGSEMPPTSAVVPKQMALLTHHCLGNLKLEYESVEAQTRVQQLALAGYTAARESAKRLRTSA